MNPTQFQKFLRFWYDILYSAKDDIASAIGLYVECNPTRLLPNRQWPFRSNSQKVSATVFDSPDYPGGTGGPDDPSGCLWCIVSFCIALLLFVGYLKWMS